MFETSEHFTLRAIPFFVLAGAFRTTGGVARRMIRFAVASVGHLHGGLAIASVMACCLFAAVSGSSPATVVAVGSIVIAGMVRSGYTQAFAAGRSEEHTSELQSLMRISYAVFCLKKKRSQDTY